MQIAYNVESLKTGGYMAYCPAMKPVIVQGATEKEAEKKLLAVAKLYIDRHPEIRDTLRYSDLED